MEALAVIINWINRAFNLTEPFWGWLIFALLLTAFAKAFRIKLDVAI